MRLGVIGLGRIGAFHASTLLATPGVESIVVTDLAGPRVDEVVADLGHDRVLGVTSAETLLRSGVDGVVIAAGTESHAELIMACAEAEVPVFCEKPVAETGPQTADLVRRLGDSPVPIQVGFQRRHDDAFVAVKEAVDSGELGFIGTIRSTTLDPEPREPQFVATSGGLFRDCAVHDFDAIRWVSGQEVVEVYAAGSNQGAEFFRDYGDFDTAAVVVTLTQGTLALVSNTRYNGRGYDVRLEVHGSSDSVAAGIGPGWPIRSTEPDAVTPARDPHWWFLDRFAGAYRKELEVFTQVVAGSCAPPCTIHDGLEATWIAEACNKSVLERRPVRLEEVRT